MRPAPLLLPAAGPAAAHHGERRPAGLAQLDPGVREMRRARQNPAATSHVPEQNRTAAEAGAAGIDDAAGRGCRTPPLPSRRRPGRTAPCA